MTDKELLELAAKAAGYAEWDWLSADHWMNVYDEKGKQSSWNPLTDDGDAFRLAAKLGFDLKFGKSGKASLHKNGDWYGTATGPRCGDPAASMRRAIVRLAATRSYNRTKTLIDSLEKKIELHMAKP